MRIAATSLLHCGQPEWGVRRVILDHDVGLSEAEGGSLVGVLDQHRGGDTGELSSFENGGGDVRGEVSEAENLGVI